jgi:hypothetical protein
LRENFAADLRLSEEEGALGMPVARFLAANAVSAAIWIAALPGSTAAAGKRIEQMPAGWLTLGNEHRSAAQRAAAQAGKRLIGLGEGINFDRGLDARPRRQREELLRVAPRQVGDRTDDPLLP